MSDHLLVGLVEFCESAFHSVRELVQRLVLATLDGPLINK